MGFYGSEPVTSATAVYVWTGLREPGFFVITASGDAPNFTSGIQLVRDPDFVGGLKVNVMGWTGPLGAGTTPYTVRGTFAGMFVPRVVVAGTNQTLVVDVKEIPHDEAEQFLAAQHGMVAAPPAAAAAG